MWKIQPTDEYQRRYRRFEKKHWRELEAAQSNLRRYFNALQEGTKPAQIQGGWIHSEKSGGVIAVDQKGGGKKQDGVNLGKGLRQTRLYIFPEVETEILHAITIGDKSTQSEDIQYAKRYVQSLAESRVERTRNAPPDVQQRGGDGSQHHAGQVAGR